jgi:pimeloyl-ACP methyl ester carboxylesterase
MDKKEIEVSGNKVVYHISGEGETIMFIHGFGEDDEVWENQVEFLKDKFRIIIPDLPGSGESGVTANMSMEGMADIIKRILDTEFSEAQSSGKFMGVCMIGHSMGGYITLAFAEKYPGYLRAYGLFHSTAFADTEEKKATRRKGIDFINEHGAFEFLKTTTPNLFSPFTHAEKPELIDKQIKRLNNFSAGALVSYYEAMIQRPDRTHILSNSTIPVLFIAGKSDNAIPLSDCLKQCWLPALSCIHILGYSGHMGMLEEPGKTNLILEHFFNKAAFT